MILNWDWPSLACSVLRQVKLRKSPEESNKWHRKKMLPQLTDHDRSLLATAKRWVGSKADLWVRELLYCYRRERRSVHASVASKWFTAVEVRRITVVCYWCLQLLFQSNVFRSFQPVCEYNKTSLLWSTFHWFHLVALPQRNISEALAMAPWKMILSIWTAICRSRARNSGSWLLGRMWAFITSCHFFVHLLLSQFWRSVVAGWWRWWWNTTRI